jgi:hypothetical protein
VVGDEEHCRPLAHQQVAIDHRRADGQRLAVFLERGRL